MKKSEKIDKNLKTQIFSGIKILDFTQAISGSLATSIMADLGAEVIKVEQPEGDPLRMAAPVINGESTFFMLHNRNKKSICIDLKKPEGIEIIKELISYVDVIAENFKPGIMKKFCLDYEGVRCMKDDIIYMSISGFGHNNRYSNMQAYDNIIQAFSGLASLNGMPNEDIPLRSPLSISDYVSGIYGALSVSAALYHRAETGEGQNVDLAMYDSLISIMDNSFLIYDYYKDKFEDMNLSDMGLKNIGNRHPGASPHGYYKTKNGYIAHMSLTNQMWNKLLNIINRYDLIEHPDFADNTKRTAVWQEVDKIIESWTCQFTSEEVIEILKSNKLPCEKVRSIANVYNDKHNDERGIFENIDHPKAGKIKLTNLPLKFSKTPPVIKEMAPCLGEHTYNVCTELLNYSESEVNELIKNRVIYSNNT